MIKIENKLTDRDIAILRFIHEFGFCEVKQIMKRFGLGLYTTYLQMRVLKKLGMVEHLYVIPHKAGVYFVSPVAIKLLNLDLNPVKKISSLTYVHQLTLIDVYLKLKASYPKETGWVTERRLIQQHYAEKRNNKTIPDGVILLPDNKPIAIEIERVQKAKKRLEEILFSYALQEYYQEVWYFCIAEVFKLMQEIASELPLIKVHLLEAFLGEGEDINSPSTTS